MATPNIEIMNAAALRILVKLCETTPLTVRLTPVSVMDDEMRRTYPDAANLEAVVNATIARLHQRGYVEGNLVTSTPLNDPPAHQIPSATISPSGRAAMERTTNAGPGNLYEEAHRAIANADSRRIALFGQLLSQAINL